MTWARSSLRRLLDAPAAAVGTALLVLVTAFVFALGPRVLDALADQTVRDEIRAAGPQSANLQLTEIARFEAGTPDPLGAVGLRGETFATQLPTTVQAVLETRRYAVDSPRWSIRSPLMEPGTLTMRFQDGVADRIDYTSGRAPTGATHTVAAAAVPGFDELASDTRVTVLETSVSEQTAALLGLHLGDVLALGLDGSDQLVGAAGDGAAPCAVELVGIFRPVDPHEPLWYGEPGLLQASTRVYGPSFAINDARALMAPDAYPSLMALTGPQGTVFRNQWRYFVAPERIEARDLGDLTAALQRTESIFPTSATVARQAGTAQLTSGLADLLEGFEARWSFATAVMAAGAVGPAVMAIGALGLIALLSARGRRSVLGRWRTRGASTPQVLRATLAEGLIVAGPAALAGCAAAIVMFAGGPPEASLLTGGLVLAAGVILVGGLEIPPALIPKAGGGGDRDETLGARVADVRPDRRAVAAELAILLLAVASIILLRARGAGDPDGAGISSPNPMLVSAPALGGIAAALIARRLIPAPIRGLSTLAARRRGLVVPLAMRRAGRHGGHGAVLTVLLATTAITVFSAATVASLDHGADLVAWQRVGADYRVASAFRQLPDGLDESTIPGVVGSSRAFRGTASIDADLTANDLLVLDAQAYSALVRGTPADPRLPAELVEPRPATLPVILSTLTATRARVTSVGDAFELRIRNQRIPAHVAEIRDVFPSLPANGAFVVASGDQVAALGGSLLLPPTDAFIAAPDGARDALLAALSSLGTSVQLLDRAETASSLRDRPVNRAVATVVLGAAAVAGAYAALALVASLALAGAARSIEVVHLRMLGLTSREATMLLVLEYAPVLGLALLVGAAVGLGLFAVLGGSLGLNVLLSASIEIPLALQPLPLALAVGGIVAVTALSVWLSGLLQGGASAQGAIRRGME